MLASTLLPNGQVTVPEEIREQLHLNVGDLVLYEIHQGSVIVRRAEAFDAPFHEALASTLDEWVSPSGEEAFRDL